MSDLACEMVSCARCMTEHLPSIKCCRGTALVIPPYRHGTSSYAQNRPGRFSMYTSSRRSKLTEPRSLDVLPIQTTISLQPSPTHQTPPTHQDPPRSHLVLWQRLLPWDMPIQLIPDPQSRSNFAPGRGIRRFLPVHQDHDCLHHTDVRCTGGDGPVQQCLCVGKQLSVQVRSAHLAGCSQYRAK